MQSSNWIQDPTLQNIPTEKLMFLQALLQASSSLSQKDMIPFLFAFQKKMQESNITFEQDEMTLILEVIQKNATADEMRMLTMLQSYFHTSSSS